MQNKVIIIGCPGSGKSTFARKLHSITKLPLVYLDRLYWNCDKTTVAKDVFMERLYEALKKEQWIIDGNYQSTLELRIQSCEQIIFLDYPLQICLDGVKSRIGKKREDMPWIETTVDQEFIHFIQNYENNQKPEIIELLNKYSQKSILVFHSRKQADEYLTMLCAKEKSQ